MIDGTPIGIARELVRDLAHGMEQACKGDIGRPENVVARIGDGIGGGPDAVRQNGHGVLVSLDEHRKHRRSGENKRVELA